MNNITVEMSKQDFLLLAEFAIMGVRKASDVMSDLELIGEEARAYEVYRKIDNVESSVEYIERKMSDI